MKRRVAGRVLRVDVRSVEQQMFQMLDSTVETNLQQQPQPQPSATKSDANLKQDTLKSIRTQPILTLL